MEKSSKLHTYGFIKKAKPLIPAFRQLNNAKKSKNKDN